MTFRNGGYVHDEPHEARKGNSQFGVEEEKIFSRWLNILKSTGVPFVVGGAFAVNGYTGIWRNTKDMDVFLQPHHVKIVLDACKAAGFRTEVPYGNWLAKVHQDPYLLDLIFGIWNGHLPVDAEWFRNNPETILAGVQVKLPPLEELIASKVYVASRDRFDGGDVAHLIRCSKGKLDWNQVVRRMGDNYEILLLQLLLFDFIYPGHSDYLPKDLIVELFEKVRKRWSKEGTDPRTSFRGTLLDTFSFLVDIHDWGYKDNRRMEPILDEEGRLIEKSLV
jgi:hypothetical protein